MRIYKNGQDVVTDKEEPSSLQELSEILFDEDDLSGNDPSLEELRTILIGHYRDRITLLQTEVDNLSTALREVEESINDDEAIVSLVRPIVASAIKESIQESKDEMIEALYPITGRLVTKAVTEAIRDLARTIDAQTRTIFSVDNLKRRVFRRSSGVSEAEENLRDLLPFQIVEIFLIHKEDGLLLRHLSFAPEQISDPEEPSDSDLISSMFTAIRDFAAEAFGRGQQGQLDEIQYGDRRILLEAGRYAYMAVVVEGVEPRGFRSRIREYVYTIEQQFGEVLRHYDGNAEPFAGVNKILRSLAK